MSSNLQRHVALVLSASAWCIVLTAGCSLLVDTGGLSQPAAHAASDSGAPESGTSDAAGDGASMMGGDAGNDAALVDGDAAPSIADLYAAAVRADGPSMYLRLDEQSGNVASDANGGPTRFYFGAVVHGVPGAFPGSTAMRLDGTNGGIDAGPVFDFDGVKPFTLEVWHLSAKIDMGYRFIFAKDTTDSMNRRQEYGVYCQAPAGFFLERYVDGGSASTGPTTIPADGVFHHVVATYDGAQAAFWLDGVRTSTFADARLATTKPTNLYVGAHDPAYGTLFGDLDEVAVYEKALTAERIGAHYHAAGR